MTAKRQPRQRTMLLVTGDNGSISWQKAPDNADTNPDYLVAGGYISGPSQPVAVATELLRSLRKTSIEVGYNFTYEFPQQGRVSHSLESVGDKDEPATIAQPVYDPEPSEMDIVAAQVYGIQLGSTTYTFNDHAHNVINDYLVDSGARTAEEIAAADTVESADDADDSDGFKTITIY